MRRGRNVLSIACLALLAACGPVGDSGGRAAAGNAAGNAATEGQPAPVFELEAIDGTRFSLADSAGQVRLIDFWATWCAPCREEIPMFKELYETYREAGFTIIAISDETSGVVREFVADNDIPYPNLVDEGEVAESYGVLALPSAYLIDREGKIVESFTGPKPRRILEEKIRKLLEAAPAT